MGYDAHPPGSRIADALNELETLLRSLPVEGAIEGLDLLETLTRNVIQHPTEEKYRRVRTTNEKLATYFGLPNAKEVMEEMGWIPDGEFLVLPRSVQLDFPKHVVKILEAKSFFGKKRELAKRTTKGTGDPNKAEMLKQLELDRRERAGPKPVPTVTAVAVAATAVAPTARPAPPSVPAAPPAVPAAPPAVSAAVHPGGYPAAAESASAPPPAATAPSARTSAAKAGDFERRADKEDRKQNAQLSLQELRALQKDKFNDFKADPNAKESEAYKRPPATGGQQQAGWFDWMWGGSSSSTSDDRRGPGGGGSAPTGPRVKTVKDLPQPVRRGG